MTKSKEEVLSELTDMFHTCRPDDEYLEEDEDVNDDVEQVEALIADGSAPVTDKIKALHSFNAEWFPDGLGPSEQDEYRALLDRAEEILKNKT